MVNDITERNQTNEALTPSSPIQAGGTIIHSSLSGPFWGYHAYDNRLSDISSSCWPIVWSQLSPWRDLSCHPKM
jgi:hypothetical protein